MLTWVPGALAASHDVYVGEDQSAVAAATKASPQYMGNLLRGTESHEPQLELNRTYYWRIDEVGADGTVWPGAVWSFATAQCEYIDDFEGDFDWTGFGGAEDDGGGPYVKASADNPHGGSKSMETEYFNASGFSYSEAGRTFEPAQDWRGRPQTLGLYWRGKAGNISDRIYVIVEDATGATAEVAQTPDLTVTVWQAWGIPLEDLSGIDFSQVKKVFVGIGDRAGEPSNKSGFLYIDDLGLCHGRCVTGPSQDLTGDCLVNFDDHAVKADGWAGDMTEYIAMAEQWLEELLVWP
jgi:hypothetical protein